MGVLEVTVTTTEKATIKTGSVPAHAIAHFLDEQADNDLAGWLNDWSLEEIADSFERRAELTTNVVTP